MTSKLILLQLLLFISVVALRAQEYDKVSVALTTGISTFDTYSDFTRTIFLQEGRPNNRGTGNIGEGDLMPFVSVQLAFRLSAKFSVAPFAQYQFHRGKLFNRDTYVFGVTSFNDVEKRYTFPANNELRAFSAGATFRYHIIRQEDVKGYVGAGLAYMTRSHTYRELLTVNFSIASDILEQSEAFITSRRSALGIPLVGGLEFRAGKQLWLGVQVLAQFPPNLEDRLVTGGLNIRKGI